MLGLGEVWFVDGRRPGFGIVARVVADRLAAGGRLDEECAGLNPLQLDSTCFARASAEGEYLLNVQTRAEAQVSIEGGRTGNAPRPAVVPRRVAPCRMAAAPSG